MKRELTCIICPRGCTLTVETDRDTVTVSGNFCPRGKQYAVDECTHPTRTVTSSIRVENRDGQMVSVKTASLVPKERMTEVMQVIRSAAVSAPIKIGDILIPDVCGSDVVATKNVD